MNVNIELNWDEGVQIDCMCMCERTRGRKKGFRWWERQGKEPRKMVVWGLGRGDCESLFMWSVTERPSELDKTQNVVEKESNQTPIAITSILGYLFSDCRHFDN